MTLPKIIIALAAVITSCLSSTMAHSASTLPETPPDPRCGINGAINDGPFGIINWANEIAKVTGSGDIDALDTKLKSWGADGSQSMCFLYDGRPSIATIRLGINTAFGRPKSSADWDALIKAIENNHKEHPKSPAAALVEAEYWITYGWDARGTGYSSTVTDAGQKLLIERMGKAETILLESKSYASVMPVWHDQMIEVQSILDRSPIERGKTFLEGVNKNKIYYPLYFSMLNYLSPKWGGSWGIVENLVTWSVENTRETEGTSMYARIYWATYSGLPEGVKLFGDTYATWPKMKKGFEDLMQRHPKSNWNLNNFAKFSCLANDKETFVSLRKRIGDKVEDEAWNGAVTLDLCDHKLGYAK